MATGVLTIADLIATRFASAKAFGVNTIADVLRADLAAHNQMVEQMVSEMCEISSDARRIYGGSNDANMTEVDEFGNAPSQKAVSGAECGFPLKRFQYNTGWTERFMDNATVADVAQKQLDAEKAHRKQVARQIKLAIYGNTNYTFNDLNVDNVALAIKRFVNADSAVIPDGPDGTTFDGSTHTHFTAAAALAVADVTAMINTVQEHGHTGATYVAINVANEAAFRALAGFSAYVDMRMTIPADTSTPMTRLDYRKTNNRPIGLLSGAEIWVKPWAIASYAFCYDAEDARKPLVLRQRSSGGALVGLRNVGSWSTHPFGGENMEWEGGAGVWTRTNGACYYFGGAAWADPTI